MSSTASLADLKSHPAVPAPGQYFPALDGVRAFAFLLVFATHYAGLTWGWAGVDAFFVLSGFLITGILLDVRKRTHALRDFYIRRALRILPLYYGVILLVAIFYPIFHWRLTWRWLAWPAFIGNFAGGLHASPPDSAASLLANFEPLSADGRVRLLLMHFWSLCVEEQFYLIWPWLVFLVRDRKKLLAICASVVVVCPFARILCAHFNLVDWDVLYTWTPFRMDALLLGSFLALIERSNHRDVLLKTGRIGFWGMSLTALCWLIQARRAHGDYATPPWRFTWGLLFVDLLFACLIVSALVPSTVTFRLFNLRPSRWLGRISYGAYVFHYIFYAEIKTLLLGHHIQHVAKAASAIGMALTLILSWASFRWFETPFLRLKDRWAA